MSDYVYWGVSSCPSQSCLGAETEAWDGNARDRAKTTKAYPDLLDLQIQSLQDG